MQTRSQTRNLSYLKNNDTFEVDIDFDEASLAWNANKKRIGQIYKYICGHPVYQGTGKCQRTSRYIDGFCKQHSNCTK